MKKLPYQLQILNNFIYEKPHIVVRILKENGIKVIPDVVANAGGAIVCHYERIQGITDDY